MRYVRIGVLTGLMALSGLASTGQAQSMGTVDLGAGAHFQNGDTVNLNRQIGPFVSAGVHVFKNFMAEGALSYLPARELSSRVGIGAARGVFVLPFWNNSAAMLGAGFARHQFYDLRVGPDTALTRGSFSRNALQLMPAVRIGLGNRMGVRVSGLLDHFPKTDTIIKRNSWSKGLQVGLSWRFGGQKPVAPVVVMVAEPAPPMVVMDASPLPLPEPEVAPPMVVRLTTVHFAFDRSELTPIAKGKLRDAVGQLRQDQGMLVELVGHTDSKGSISYNQRLSERRAGSVRGFLIMQGVINERISTRGMGELEPIGDNRTAEGRAKNRRVEVNGKPPAR